MIDYTILTPIFETIVGFRNTANISLSDSLKTSDSGLYANALPGVSLELINSIIESQSVSVITGTLLVEGNWYEIVDVTGGADFTNIGATDNNVATKFEATGTIPTSWGTSGELITQPIIDYLNLVRVDEIQSATRQFISLMQQNFNNESLKWNGKLINNVGSVERNQRETAKGFYFKLNNSNTLSNQLKSISLQLSQIDTVRLYLYEFGKTAAISSFDYTSLTNQISFETLTDWVLKYTANDNTSKEYLLLYYDYDPDNIQADIQLESTTKYITSTNDCYCNNRDMLRYLYARPIDIPNRYWNWNVITSEYDIPNLENRTPLSFCSDSENGINVDMNVTCDITQILIDNKLLFAKILQFAYAIRILSDSDTTNRANRTERNATEYDNKYVSIYNLKLFGDMVINEAGNSVSIEGEIMRIVRSFKNIDNECFVDKNKDSNGFCISNAYQNTNR